VSVDPEYWRTGAEPSPVALQRAEPSPLDPACAASRRTRMPRTARWAWALSCFLVAGVVIAGLARRDDPGNPDQVAASSQVVRSAVAELELPRRTESRVIGRQDRTKDNDRSDGGPSHAGGHPIEEPKHRRRRAPAAATNLSSQPVTSAPATSTPAVPVVVEPEQPPAAEIVPAQDAPSSDFSFGTGDR